MQSLDINQYRSINQCTTLKKWLRIVAFTSTLQEFISKKESDIIRIDKNHTIMQHRPP